MTDAATDGRRAQATVDLAKCVGSTLCVQIASDVFRLTENGQSEATTVGGCAAIMDAAEACPLMAITVTDAESGDVLFP